MQTTNLTIKRILIFIKKDNIKKEDNNNEKAKNNGLENSNAIGIQYFEILQKQV